MTSSPKYNIDIRNVDAPNSEWITVAKNRLSDVQIHGLTDGSSHILRCRAVNANGIEGVCSESSPMFHTLLSYNGRPSVQEVGSDFARLSFGTSATAHKRNIEEYHQWIQHESKEIHKVFKEVLIKGNPSMEINENHEPTMPVHLLPQLLTCLGTKPSSIRLEALSQDQTDGSISLSAVTRWWNDTSPLAYTIRRSDSNESLVCYNSPRRDDDDAMIQGLHPNTKYSFSVRYTTSRTTSLWCDDITCTTLPRTPPFRPALVRITHQMCLLKINGFDAKERYRVEHLSVSDKRPQWRTVFNGAMPKCLVKLNDFNGGEIHKFRIRGLNSEGSPGKCSGALTITIAGERGPDTSIDILKEFTIDCTADDIIVGDRVLLDEYVEGNTLRTIAVQINAIFTRNETQSYRMEVLWCHCSRLNSKAMLEVGQLVERPMDDFAERVLRTKWASEDDRR